MRLAVITAAIAAFALTFAGAAFAHASISPPVAKAKVDQQFTLSVPTDVQRGLPAVFAGVAAGWSAWALPFFPTGWPFALAALAAAVTLVHARRCGRVRRRRARPARRRVAATSDRTDLRLGAAARADLGARTAATRGARG